MGALFYRLLDDGLCEISRREPDYLSRFPSALPAIDSSTEHYLQQALFRSYSASQIGRVLSDGLAYLGEQGARFAEPTAEPDPVARLMLDNIMDAFAADQGDLPLPPCPRPDRRVGDVLTEEYDHHQVPDGRRYFVRRRGHRPLLLINALGIPLTMWSKLLADPSHEFRIVVVESRCGDLLCGGMKSDANLTQHATDIGAILDREAFDQIDVLAWCNGGRVAIDLANRRIGQIRSLILLSTTLRGIKGITPSANPFEDNLQQVFAAVAVNHAHAGPLVKMLGRPARSPDWDNLVDDPAARAAALFRLPAKEHTEALLAPMSRAEFLINYGRRTASDEAYPIHEALSKLEVPVLLITGDHDNVVSNALICAAFTTWPHAVVHASVTGAGHYVHDLQYPYLCCLLGRFLDGGPSMSTARVAMQQLGQ